MKKRKQILSIFLLLFMLSGIIALLPLKASASGMYSFSDSASQLAYNILSTDTSTASGTVSVSGSSGKTTSYTIPETVQYDGNTYTVTEIEPHAFINQIGVTSVSIPDTVTNIGDGAFYNCRLLNITLSENVTYIGAEAFAKNFDLHATFMYGDQKTYIAANAFTNTRSLTNKLVAPKSVNVTRTGTFWGCQIENYGEYNTGYNISLYANGTAVKSTAVEKNPGTYTSLEISDMLSELGAGKYTVYVSATAGGYAVSELLMGNTFEYNPSSDTSKPVISDVSVERNASTGATIKFKSSKNGHLYYVKDNNLNTSGAPGLHKEVSADVEKSFPIEIANASDTPTVKFAVKDYLGNVSETYTLTVPEYTYYTLTYDGNGKSLGTTPEGASGNEYAKNDTVSVAEGFNTDGTLTFTEWNTKADGTGTSYAPNDTFEITEDTTLYAIWKCQITVTDPDSSGGFSYELTKELVDIDGSTQLTVTVLDGYERSANYAVTAGGATLQALPSIDPLRKSLIYNISNIQQNTAVEVSGIKIADYTVTVSGGRATADGVEISEAAEGATVTVIADDAPEGKRFSHWTVVANAVTLADAQSPTTTFTMIGSNVSVIARYEDIPHSCSFGERVADDKYKVSDATCQSPAVYYVSCSCGEAGTETFEHGEKNGESHTKATFTYTDIGGGDHAKIYECCAAVSATEAHSYGESGKCICSAEAPKAPENSGAEVIPSENSGTAETEPKSPSISSDTEAGDPTAEEPSGLPTGAIIAIAVALAVVLAGGGGHLAGSVHKQNKS